MGIAFAGDERHIMKWQGVRIVIRQYTVMVKNLLNILKTLAKRMDEWGIRDSIPFIDPEEGIWYNMRMDILSMFIYVLGDQEPVCQDGMDYLNECLDSDLTALTFEKTRERIRSDPAVPKSPILLPYFAMIDKKAGNCILSCFYLQVLFHVAAGYLQHGSGRPVQEMTRCCRYMENGRILIREILHVMPEHDPVELSGMEKAPLIRIFLMLDKILNHDPVTEKYIKDVITMCNIAMSI